MAYYFAVETEKDNYIAKNIKKSGYFGNESIYPKAYECSLEEIDAYTTNFQNEVRVKSCLFSEDLLSEDDMDKPLAIIYSEGFKRRLVNGNILYQNSKELISNPLETIKYINTKVEENDYTFFRTLSARLPEDSISKSLVAKVASLVEKQAVSNSEVTELSEKNVFGSNLVIEVSKLLIYSTYIDEEGAIKCTQELNYENFHNLVSFISDYEQTLNKEKNVVPTRVRTKNTSV